jgi:metallo-beta-lactamase class B
MFARSVVLIASLTILSFTPVAGRPTASLDARTQGATLAKACKDRDGWSDAAPPARIFGNTYYVGTCGISVVLVTSRKGHVLIDGATDEAVPSILANIRALGFKPRDVRFIVGSHEHVDHMGGFAALKAATGAKLLVSAAARPVVETGKTDADDPQFGIIPDMKPVAVDGILTYRSEPDTIIKGEPTKIMSLTPHPTPGHTSGGTSWTWQSCEGAKCATFAYVDSMSAVSADSYRFTDHPKRVAPFRATFDRVAALKCDVLITPHPGVSQLFERLAGQAPLVDPNACRRLVAAMRQRIDERLAKERAQ